MPVRFLTSLLLTTILFSPVVSGPAVASELSDCKTEFTAADGNHDFLEKNGNPPPAGTRIRNIHITRLPIFNELDPKENNWLFRSLNRLHLTTTEANITQQLLFAEGEVFDSRVMEESARLLRQLNHLYDAGIRIVSTCQDVVDLEVITRDIWSLNFDISYSRSGGENEQSFGIAESNLFGRGKEVFIRNKKDQDRKSLEVGYKDNNLFGTRMRFGISYSDADDGSNKFVRLGLPFYSLDSKRSWGLRVWSNERVDKQYFRGEDVSEINHETEDYSVYHGFSDGLREGVARRWVVGYRTREDVFAPGKDLPPPAETPRNRKMNYPFLQYEAIEDNYTTSFNLDQIHRTEDLHLGYTFHNSIGYADSAFGSDLDRFIVSGGFRDTLLYNEKILLQHAVNWHGIWNADEHSSEDIVLSYNIKYFRGQRKKRSFFAQFNTVWTHNLNSNEQIVLGGATGVRGFDNRMQVGDRRMVLTLEERQYTDYHVLNLAYLGFAVFVDLGRAWEPDVDDGLKNKLLADIGFGLRLASSKTDGGRVIHIDFAFPMTNRNEPDVDNFQLVIKVKNTL